MHKLKIGKEWADQTAHQTASFNWLFGTLTDTFKNTVNALGNLTTRKLMAKRKIRAMTTEERLEKLEREIKEMKTLICTKKLCVVNDQGQECMKLFVGKDVEETVVEGKNLDFPTFKRRNIMIQKVQPTNL